MNPKHQGFLSWARGTSVENTPISVSRVKFLCKNLPALLVGSEGGGIRDDATSRCGKMLKGEAGRRTDMHVSRKRDAGSEP